MSLWNLGAGALAVLMGFALLIAGPSLVADPDFRAQVERDMPADFPGGYAAIAEAIPAVGALFLLMGLGMAAVGYGMWQAKPWAWTGMMALAGLWLLSSLLMFLAGVFFAILSAFLLWYFTRPGVKRWFGREVPPDMGFPPYVPPP